jgi:hypothetical protein
MAWKIEIRSRGVAPMALRPWVTLPTLRAKDFTAEDAEFAEQTSYSFTRSSSAYSALSAVNAVKF